MTIDITKTLFLIVDIQNDFCPGGALAVNDGDKIITAINSLSKIIAGKGGRVAASQDWHPQDHVSFESTWPPHCVQGTPGADFHKDLDLKPVSLIIRKGFRKELDSYSAFFENDRTTPTGLEGWIHSLGIETVVLGGIASDYCVFYSAMDSRKAGFRTIVVSDAVKGVGIPEGSVEAAIKEMEAEGVEFICSGEIELGLK